MFLPYLKQLRYASSHLILANLCIMLGCQIISLGLLGFQNSLPYPILHNNNCILGRENGIRCRIAGQISPLCHLLPPNERYFFLGNNIGISNKSLMAHKKLESVSCRAYHSCVNMEAVGQQLSFLSPFHEFQILFLPFKIEMILCFKSQASHIITFQTS